MLAKNFGITTLVCVCLLIVPQLFFVANFDEFSKDYALPLITSGFAIVLLLLGGLISPRLQTQYVLSGVGLAILVCDQFLRMQIKHLDGSGAEIVIEPITASLNTIVYIGLPLLTYKFGDKLKRTFVDISYLALFSGILLTSYSLFQAFAAKAGNDEIVSPQTNTPTGIELPNVYIVWLDAMQTEYMEQYVKTDDNLAAFSGFKLFLNNSSNYLYTTQSYTSFMSGTLFTEGNYSDWTQKENRLRETLASMGYRITTYAKKDFISELDDVVFTATDIFQNRTEIKHPFIEDFIAYSLVRISPGVLANHSLTLGRLIGGSIANLVNSESDYSQVKSIADGIEPLSGVFTLEQLIADESNRSNRNELVIAQAIIPHGPFVIDENCKYKGRDQTSTQEQYYQQVRCSGNLVREFFNELKRLDRYHSSIIIVMGDHGSGWASLIEGERDGEPPLNPKFTPWSDSMVISRASALLMIKPGNSSAQDLLSFSEQESQLIDLYPTLMGLLESKERIETDVDGIDLFSPPTDEREKFITYFRPSKLLNLFQAEIYDLSFDRNDKAIAFRSLFMSENSLPPLQCEQILDFSSNEMAAGHYFSSGLSDVERWGRWSDRDRVELTIKVPPKRCDDQVLTFYVRGLTTDEHPIQRAHVSYNGKLLGNASIKAGEEQPKALAFPIPDSLFKPNSVATIEISLPDSVSPEELGINDDKRKIALGFESMSFQ